MSPFEFYEVCNSHDWYYAFSDDDSVYRRGLMSDRKLSTACKEDPLFEAIYNIFFDYYDSRGNTMTPSWENIKNEVHIQ